jgi:hypothetical protein
MPNPVNFIEKTVRLKLANPQFKESLPTIPKMLTHPKPTPHIYAIRERKPWD